jgi:hypothetical protein
VGNVQNKLPYLTTLYLVIYYQQSNNMMIINVELKRKCNKLVEAYFALVSYSQKLSISVLFSHVYFVEAQ